MISVEEATARITRAMTPVDAETVPVGTCAGRVLAEDVVARVSQPPNDVSAMDGYAVRARDAAEVPASLRVTGTAPAGRPFAGTVGAGEAVRIFTGAVMPEGSDTVVIQENTETEEDRVRILQAPQPGQNVRVAGLDFRAGDVLLRAGRAISPIDAGLIAAGDVARVSVRRRPRIAFVATGDELSRPGESRTAGGIVASTGYALAPLIAGWGGEPADLGILPDHVEAFAGLADRAAEGDFLVTLGGASVGDHDLVQTALAPQGFALDFWKIAMRPGKPLIFGRLRDTPMLGLPGNPVSALICAVLFLQPAIAALLGRTDLGAQPRRARLAGPLAANDARASYLRAELENRGGELWARAFPVQDSSMLRTLAASDVLIVRAPHAPPAATGESVNVLPLAAC